MTFRKSNPEMKRTLNELAEQIGAEVLGDGTVEISGVNSIEGARPGEITFLSNPKYLPKLQETKASAVIVAKNVSVSEKPLLRVENPQLAFVKLLHLFFPGTLPSKGIDPGAYIHSTARLGNEVTVYPFVYIGERCRIDDRVTLYPGVYIGDDVTIGEGSVLYPNVSVYHGSIIGRRVILHAGVVIGSDGFGYVKEGKRNVKIPQVGIVVIEDDVEIGANTTVDRAAFGRTVVGRGVKIDNLVQVAHNVIIGEDSILCAQVGVAGSTTVGSNVYLAGQVGLSDHITVGDNVLVGAQSGVPSNLSPNAAYSGCPVLPHRESLRVYNVMQKLPEMRKMVLDMEKRLAKVEQNLSPEGKDDD